MLPAAILLRSRLVCYITEEVYLPGREYGVTDPIMDVLPKTVAATAYAVSSEPNLGLSNTVHVDFLWLEIDSN